MSNKKTPREYIVEKNAFPNSVIEVATAVPAFIGYTEFAKDSNKSLLNKPWKVNSLAEFELFFGGAPNPNFSLKEEQPNANKETKLDSMYIQLKGKQYSLQREDRYNFYYQTCFYFANGGGTCYIVSVDEGYTNKLEKSKLIGGITALQKVEEVTMVIVPEAVYLDSLESCSTIQKAILQHCGRDMKNRIGILDIYEGFVGELQKIDDFREHIQTDYLSYGTTYYPWLNTTIVKETEINFQHVTDSALLAQLLTESDQGGELASFITAIQKNPTELTQTEIDTAHNALFKHSALYFNLMSHLLLNVNRLPPSTAMAGIYVLVDETKEVWKAPANIGVSNVISPTVNISFETQENLNTPLNGKAINAIRFFPVEGIKVWGARTLDGNSINWRYINVRRTIIMLEESIKNAAKAFVFEPNVANTWVSLNSMIYNFLYGIWKRGGLAGAVPEDAFSVHIGLGETMTPEDILEGIMRINILVAISRPAEFIEITFQQQMQKS